MNLGRRVDRRAPEQRSAWTSRGAAAVEFALLLPLLIGLIFGVVEAGWTLEQRHSVRADANDLARQAAINFSESTIADFDALLGTMCDDLGLEDDDTIVIELPDGNEQGDRVVVTITSDLEEITGFFGQVLGGKNVTSTGTAVLEQDAAFVALGGQQCDGTTVVTPTPTPTSAPTATPVPAPTSTPTPGPTATPTEIPTATPTGAPTATPTSGPTATPTTAPTATPTTPPTPTPTVAPTATPQPTCTVPDFDNVRKNNATSLWTGAGFTGSITFQSGSGNYRIDFQSLDDGDDVPCTSSITVGP